MYMCKKVTKVCFLNVKRDRGTMKAKSVDTWLIRWGKNVGK